MTRNAILFHLGDDPFTPGGLGVSLFERGTKCRVKIRRREETVPRDLDRCARQQLVTEVIETGNDKAVVRD